MAAHFRNEDSLSEDVPTPSAPAPAPARTASRLSSAPAPAPARTASRFSRAPIDEPMPQYYADSDFPEYSQVAAIPDLPPDPPSRPWLRVLLTVVGVCVVLLLAFGAVFAVSAFGVLGQLDDAKTQALNLEQSLLNGEADLARTQSSELESSLVAMRDRTHGRVWSFASHLPLVGQDVSNVQALTDCACDLSQNALTPLVNSVAGMRLHDLVEERSVNTGMLASMRESVVAVSPVVVNNARTIAALQPGVIGPINQKLDMFRDPLNAAADLLSDADQLFGLVLNLLGDGGQTRTYVLLAQTNAEIRAGGGFPGSVGMVQVTDGYAELSEFHSVSEVQGIVRANGFSASITEEELAAFGDVLGTDAAGPTLTPNFVRSGQIVQQQWQNAYGYAIDGVVAMDPVFLQRVLALTGGITAFDGTEVNGDNAAAELLHDVYLRYGYDENGGDMEDLFFNDVAHQSFSKLLDTMGSFELDAFARLWNTLRESGADHRFQVWMADQTLQGFLHDMSLTGEIQSDVNAPELGVYANDNTWSKMCWYLDISADLANARTNEDGTTTYDVTAHFRNTIGADEAAQVPQYITGGNPLKRDVSDMIETVYLMAPLGATIADYEVHQDVPLPEESMVPDEHYTLYDRDTWRSRIQIMAGGDTYVTFTLTMPAGVGEPTVRTSPLCT